MKRRAIIGYFALGLAAFLSFLAASAPAGWLAWGVARLSNGALHVTETRGTIWQGGGRLVLVLPPGSAMSLGDVSWRLQPSSLMRGRAALALTATGPESALEGVVALGRGKLMLQGLRASCPAALVGRLHPTLAFGAKGRLRLETPMLTLTVTGLEGKAELRWEQAGSEFSSVRPLGGYRLELAGRGKDATLALQTLEGPLELSGQGRWDVLGSGDLQLSGLARARERREELQPLLRLMGRDLGSGRSAFVLRLRVPLAPVAKKLSL